MTLTQAERAAWQAADRVLDALFDLPVTDRARHLAALDLAPELRQRVERLLAAHEHDDGVLDHPCIGSLAPERDALAGRRLGRWQLDHEIGRGGMAVVYRAHSLEGPAGQDAALKVMTLGALAGSGRSQFLREQQVLLRLRHPYIAPLHDAGIADDGTPWLAMARVEGERIDAWCDARGLDAAARVRLLLQVCEAVAHAHRNLVIHRDIKPSNVLVDDDGRVRLLDFGIARATDAVGERTATALRALTPDYAAPEQFEGAPATTAMDVYGIGALLYRLLAGVAPRPADAVGAAAPASAPSRALRRSTLEPGVRQQRMRSLRGDLDAIVMKALAPAPDARYGGVEAFAEDLKRWLDGKPVRAQPPSLQYRLRKFGARNRLALAAATAVVLALCGGIAAALWQARIARDEAERARSAADRSEAQLQYLHSVMEVLAPATEATRELDRHEVVAEAARRAQRDLHGRPELLASVQLSLGDIAQRTGDYPQAHALFAGAATARQRQFGTDSGEYGEALARLGGVTALVDPPEPVLAETRLREAADLLRRHQPGSATLVAALRGHASVLADLDRYDASTAAIAEAARLCEGQLDDAEACDEVWSTQAQLYTRREQHAAALAAFRRLVDWRRAHYGADHAKTAFAQGRLGLAHSRAGDHDRGIALLDEAYARLQRIHATPTEETLLTLQNLAETLVAGNRMARAFDAHRQAVAMARELFGARSPELALGLTQYGNVLFADGRYADAAARYREGADIYRELYGPDGAATAIAQGNHADALGELGEHAQALQLVQQALTVYRKVFGEQAPRTAGMWGKVGDQLLANRRVDDALAAYARSLAILRAAPDGMAVRRGIALARSKRALALQMDGQAAQAEAEARAAEREMRELTGGEGVYYGLALANLLRTACASGADDCAALRIRARALAADVAQPGGNRLRLQAALGEVAGA